MRLAIFAWETLHSVAVGGVAAHASGLAHALAKRGHEVHVFTRRVHPQRTHDLIQDVHYHRVYYPAHAGFVDEVNSMCRALVDRFFEVEDFIGHFDVVHAHDWLVANAMIWIKQGRGHPCVLTIHSTEYARCGNTFANGRSVRVREQERAGTYWADRVIAVSQATADELAWMYEVPQGKTRVVYNGVDYRDFDIFTDPGEDREHYQIGPMDPVILFCGRLAWQKGPDLLLEAVPEILGKHPWSKVVFLGDGEMRQDLERRAGQLGVQHALRFLGYRNGEELVRLFKLSDLVCVPSRNEPFGIVILEAWSAEKPVLVTQQGGPSEFVQHEVNGLKIYPNRESILWGVDYMYSDFEQARAMGRRGRSILEDRFTWDVIAQQVLDVYTELVPQPVESPPAVSTPAPSDSVPTAANLFIPPEEGMTHDWVELEALLTFAIQAEHQDNEDLQQTFKRCLDQYEMKLKELNGCLHIKGAFPVVLEALVQCYLHTYRADGIYRICTTDLTETAEASQRVRFNVGERV